MRTYYVFKMKKEFVSLYKENPSSLFNVLKHLYYMKKQEAEYGSSLFHQLTEKIEKEKMDRDIYIKYHKEMIYTKNKEEHIINNLYKDEVSILTIKNAYILITASNNYTTFFQTIADFGEEYFVCDFTYQDYFWINEMKMLV